MIFFKPRLVAFYLMLFVAFTILSNRATVKNQMGSTEIQNTTMGGNAH